MKKITNDELLGAIARGWCYDKNQSKNLDPDLINAIALEVYKLTTTTPLIQPIADWLNRSTTDDLVECEQTVDQQLSQLDSVGTGIGYIYFLAPVISDKLTTSNAGTSGEQTSELHLSFQAVVKIRNIWYVATDDNVSDILCALVRIIIEAIPQ